VEVEEGTEWKQGESRRGFINLYISLPFPSQWRLEQASEQASRTYIPGRPDEVRVLWNGSAREGEMHDMMQ